MFGVRPADLLRGQLQTRLHIDNDIRSEFIAPVAVVIQVFDQKIHSTQNPEHIECRVQHRVVKLTASENTRELLKPFHKYPADRGLNWCEAKIGADRDAQPGQINLRQLAVITAWHVE